MRSPQKVSRKIIYEKRAIFVRATDYRLELIAAVLKDKAHKRS